MKKSEKTMSEKMMAVVDLLISPFVYVSALVLSRIRKIGISHFPVCKKILIDTGVFPIINHYYEPLFDPRQLRKSLRDNRNLPGIDWNTDEQLRLLDHFRYSAELADIPTIQTDDLSFYWGNIAFESGDAEYWYNSIRAFKPRVIIEIGSGFSTRMAVKAIRKNQEENQDYHCTHICVEPYENPWLESLGVQVIRKRVETLDSEFFRILHENDILFIDSSHLIRPQGDVLFEYLELLPTLDTGVIIHIHDIFSPKDYLDEWIRDGPCFWNEQYLLEAFLTSNDSWKITGALNYLHHNHYEKLKEKCPYLTPDREPGSFYMKKIKKIS